MTTTLVHRIQRGPLPWWRSCVVADFVGGVGPTEFPDIDDLLPVLLDAGFTAISLRPSHTDIVAAPETLTRTVARAHDLGMKVLVRLAGAGLPLGSRDTTAFEGDRAALVVRTRAALKCGADGIDLGLLDTARTPEERARSSRLIQILHAELADFDPAPILAARSTSTDDEAFRRHLEEDWFHHLRDEALLTVAWDAQALAEAITATYARRDPLGQVAAWHWSHARGLGDEDLIAPGSWEDGAGGHRRAAMALVGLSLPGVAYVPFGQLGGHLWEDGHGGFHRTWAGDENSRAGASVLAQALRLRAARGIPQGSLALVTSLPWAHPGVEVHVANGVMVVVNTSDTPVEVPAEHTLLLRSDALGTPEGSPTVLPGDTSAWFDTARVTPVPMTFGP